MSFIVLWWLEERLSKTQRSLQNVPKSSWKASIVIISRSKKWWKSQRASKTHHIVQACTSFKYIWLEDRLQGLASIVFSCFALPVIKRSPANSDTKYLTERNLVVISILWIRMELRQIVPNAKLVKMGLTGLNVPDVANGTMMVTFMHPKITSHSTFSYI